MTVRTSWTVALAVTLATLMGILVLTRDLSISDSLFKDGVSQAETVNATTDEALAGVAELPAGDFALRQSLPEVAGVATSLTTATTTLDDLGYKLNLLSEALTGANTSLEDIVTSGRGAVSEADQAAGPTGSIANRLNGINAQTKELSAQLDDTASLSHTVDTKLRIALLIPALPN